MSTPFRMMDNPDDARNAHREQQLVSALVTRATLRADKEAIDALRASMPSRATDVGAQSVQISRQLAGAEDRASGLLKLAGWSDEMIPWRTIADTVGRTLAEKEELYVRAEDEWQNARAYGIPAEHAQYNHEKAKADMEAYRAAYDDAMERSQATDAASTTAAVSAPFERGDG